MYPKKDLTFGVAPQCAVPGLDFESTNDKYGRIPFSGLEKHNNFAESYLIKNQEWILEITDIGRIKQRTE